MADVSNRPDNRSFFRRRSVSIMAALTLLSMFTASYFAGQTQALRQSGLERAENPITGGIQMPTLDATAAVSSEKFSLATGMISDRAEGLFVLDHNSGLLQCSVMYPRVGQFLGLFVVNVHDALGSGKGAEYMMVTGMVDIPQNNANPFASSVVYVLNTTTGAFACYSIPFNRTMMNSNKPQQGQMSLVGLGNADPVVDRDAVR